MKPSLFDTLGIDPNMLTDKFIQLYKLHLIVGIISVIIALLVGLSVIITTMILLF